jgi:hypothetical protein
MKMPKKIDSVKDIEVLEYLKEHTYKQTAAFFSISEKQITRIKARVGNGQSLTPEPEAKILGEIPGQPDRAKDEIPAKPAEIKREESPKAKAKVAKLNFKLDANEILLKLRTKNIRDSPAYPNLLKQLKVYGKKEIILELVNFINAEIL